MVWWGRLMMGAEDELICVNCISQGPIHGTNSNFLSFFFSSAKNIYTYVIHINFCYLFWVAWAKLVWAKWVGKPPTTYLEVVGIQGDLQCLDSVRSSLVARRRLAIRKNRVRKEVDNIIGMSLTMPKLVVDCIRQSYSHKVENDSLQVVILGKSSILFLS